MTVQQPKRKVGRPRKPALDVPQKRRFFMLEKNDRTSALMKMAHAKYRQFAGKDAPDAEVLRWCMRIAVSQTSTDGDSRE